MMQSLHLSGLRARYIPVASAGNRPPCHANWTTVTLQRTSLCMHRVSHSPSVLSSTFPPHVLPLRRRRELFSFHDCASPSRLLVSDHPESEHACIRAHTSGASLA